MAEGKLSSEKKVLILVIVLFALVAALSMAGYLSSIKNTPSVTVQPTVTPTITLTPEPSIVLTSVPSPTPKDDEVDLGRYTTKEFLGENANYSVYLLDSVEDLPGRKGKIVVYDKNKKLAIPIAGLFSIFGATIVTDDGEGTYVALSLGTSTSRGVIVLSLSEKKQIIDEFCSSHLTIFWKEYIIYTSCDSSITRPWGDGEASGIEMINLLNGQIEVPFKADLLHDFSIDKIEGNTLFYNESTVEKESDRDNSSAWKSEVKTYKLIR